MPGGAFNTAELIRQLGLKPVGPDEMRVQTSIQPVLNVGDLSDATPPHISASAFFGVLLQGGAGTVGICELQCLSPGGGFIDWITFNATTTNARFRVTLNSVAVVTPVVPAGVTSNEPIVSPVTQGAVAAPADPSVTIFPTGFIATFSSRPIFVPRGAFFQFQCATVNVAGNLGFGWREVPAAENIG